MGNVFDSQYRTTALDIVHRYRTDLSGRTAFVTGCTTGLGPEIARALAVSHCTVYISGRNATALNKVRDQLNAELKLSGQEERVHSVVCDLSSLKSIRKAAADFLALSTQLHLLVCNAGLMFAPYGVTTEGVDMQFGVNHIGHFLLFSLLQTALLNSTPSRVVVVASNGWHLMGPPRIDYSRLPAVSESQYKPQSAYQQSKLANVLFARELNQRFASRGLTAYSLNPGAVRTGLQESAGGVMNAVAWMTSAVWKSVPQGASTPVYCAVAPNIENEGGRYFNHCRVDGVLEKSKVAPDEASKLWEWSEKFIAEHAS